MYCGKCGMENQDGAKFCKGCGVKLGRAEQVLADDDAQTSFLEQGEGYVNYQAAELQGNTPQEQDVWQGQSAQQEQGMQQNQNTWQGQNVQQNQNAWQGQNTQQGQNIPYGYEPIGMWGYFGYSLLFSIPLIGLIMQLIYAFGGTSNINLRNFARAQFCVVILWVVVILIFLMPVISSFLSHIRW